VPIDYVKQEVRRYLQLGVMPSIDETTQPTNRYPAFPSSRPTPYPGPTGVPYVPFRDTERAPQNGDCHGLPSA
jgi:hypothetical protein